MSDQNPTLDDVWKLFRETAQGFLDLEQRFRETDLKFQDTNLKFQDTDRRFQETDHRFQEADHRFKETERLIKEQSAATERMLKAQAKEMHSAIGKLGNRLGDFVEDAVRPAAVRLFRAQGIDVREVQQNISVQRGNEGIEVDLLVVNDTELVAIECKSHLSIDDVNEHLERLARLKRLLPRYADMRVFGAVAAMVIDDPVARYAYRKGLFVIGQSGEDLILRNDDKFVPKVW